MRSLGVTITLAGIASVGAMLALAVSKAPLGTPLFFAMAAVAGLAYLVVLGRVWSLRETQRGLFFSALAFAVLMRAPVAVAPVSSDNDMIRYLWDGRIQRFGINPYLVLPADPEVQWTHTDETRRMPSAQHRTSYQPAAQLFFRLVVALHDSSRAMKLALVGCDLLTILVLWRWLVATGRNEWLTLVYAWNPLVVLEVAHSGHIDALGALWVTAAAYWLSRRRSALATIAYVLAVATKPLPIVLAPLFWNRISQARRAAGARALGAPLCAVHAGPQIGLGMDRVVASIRFNGPIFRGVRLAEQPRRRRGFRRGPGFRGGLVPLEAAARGTRGVGLADGDRARLRSGHLSVVLPYFTPFLFSTTTLPLVAWTFSVLPVYLVWQLPYYGSRGAFPRLCSSSNT